MKQNNKNLLERIKLFISSNLPLLILAGLFSIINLGVKLQIIKFKDNQGLGFAFTPNNMSALPMQTKTTIQTHEITNWISLLHNTQNMEQMVKKINNINKKLYEIQNKRLSVYVKVNTKAEFLHSNGDFRPLTYSEFLVVLEYRLW